MSFDFVHTEFRSPGARVSGRRGFTLVELLVLIGLLSLLLLFISPALTANRYNSHFVQCQSNLRHLIASWQVYASDNSDRSLMMTHGAGNIFSSGFAAGWLDWSGTASDNTNSAKLMNKTNTLLAPYLTGGSELFRCPADTFISISQAAKGWTCRARSYSANIYSGAGNAEAGPTDPIYRHISKTTDFIFPGPAEAWIITEEHPDSINDSALFAPSQAYWVDLPASYHHGAGAFAFADGHTEMHRWAGSLTRLSASQVQYVDITQVPTALPADLDLHWVSYRTTRITTYFY